jgi:hypothetical protein
MAGQLSQTYATALVNHAAGIVPVTVAASTAAPAWVPGLIWYDTTTSAVMVWDQGQETWVTQSSMSLYLALLTSNPSTAGTGANLGGFAATVSDIAAIEDTTAGYARQTVTFGSNPAAWSSATAYAVGAQVTYQGFVYTCATANTGTSPSGQTTTTTDWTFSNPDYPSPVANTNQVTFGAYTAAQANPVGWAALIQSASSSGSHGNLVYMWTLPVPQQAAASQTIGIPPGALTLSQS